MNQVRPTLGAMVALLMMAMMPSFSWAGVVVLSNHTSGEVHFVLADDAQKQTYIFAPNQVRTLRVAQGTEFWFADSPERGYRLRGGCAYVFLRNRPVGHLELHRLGLAQDQNWLDEEATTDLDANADAAGLGGEPTATGQATAVVQVTIAFDGADREANWQRRLSARLDEASKVISPQCGVRFEAVDFQSWQSDGSTADYDEAWRRFVSAVPMGSANVVVGYTTRSLADWPCQGFPTTTGPLTSHLLIVSGRSSLTEREQRDKLLHALGHYLGAAHSPESDSVMRPALSQETGDARASVRFDPINALAMALVGEELISAPRNFAGLNPRVRQRLASVYGTLADALPDDPQAGQFLRLLSSAAVDRATGTESIVGGSRASDHSPADAEKRSLRPAGDASRDREEESTTDDSRRRLSAGMADQAETKLDADGQREFQDAADIRLQIELPPDPSALPKALALALLLVAIPAAALVWRLALREPAQPQADGQDLAPPTWQTMQSVDRAAWSWYLAALAGVSIWSAMSILPGDGGGVKAAAALLLLGMAAMTVVPFQPIIGTLVYFVLSYALLGEDPAAMRIRHSGVLSCVPVLSVAALGVRFLRQRRRPLPPRSMATWALLFLMAWIGLAAAGAVVSGLPVSSSMVHRLGRFAQVLLLFLVTLYADVGLAEFRLTSLVLALTLFARVHIFRADVSLEQNLAMLAAIACPLLCVAAQTAPSRLAKGAFYLMLAYFVCLIAYAQNRAAMMTLPASVLVLLLSSRHRKRALLVAIPLTTLLALWLPSSGLLDRFGEIYQEGEFQGSAYWRLRIWTTGWQMARDHSLFGVGPGNFELLAGEYDSRLSEIPPHNSFVQMAAETGLPGAAIYVVFLVTAGLSLSSIVQRFNDDWRGCVTGGILASLAAHVVTGCFLENPSLAVTYVALGLGIASAAAPVTRVYRERLYLPLPDSLARPLAELVVRSPRLVSGMPVGGWSASSRREPPQQTAAADLGRPRNEPTSWLRLLLIVDMLVTVAGSLAPFSFQPMGVRSAIDHYWQQMSHNVEFADRSDWLANILLFVPLGFLGLAACCPRTRGALRVVVSLLVPAGCLLFSCAIEFAQVWFPSRSVNPNDVVAETLGSTAGVIAFLWFGDGLLDWAANTLARRPRLSAGEKLLLCYAVVQAVGIAWPFDFTVNPTDFASKLREGRIDFRDWTRPGWLADFATSAGLMAPIGVLLHALGVRRDRRSLVELAAWGLGWLLAIEFCRLLAFSQSVCLVHLVGGAAGILLGVAARKLLNRSRQA